jgi:AraC-like DNA-binding protein
MDGGFQELEPHPALAPYVDRYWARASGPDADGGPRTILPDGCIDVLVDVTRGWQAAVVGAMTRATRFEPQAPARLIAARFRPGGASPFLKVAAHELTDHVVDSGDLGLQWLAQTPLAGDAPLAEAVRVLERLLLQRLAATAPPDPVVAHVVDTLFASVPPTVETLAREIGWSRQHLRRVVRNHVGVGPVTLARVARLQRVVDLLQRGGSRRLSRVALRAGYFDQAHMNRDVRALAGVTPREAAAPTGSIRPILSLLGGRSYGDEGAGEPFAAMPGRVGRSAPLARGSRSRVPESSAGDAARTEEVCRLASDAELWARGACQRCSARSSRTQEARIERPANRCCAHLDPGSAAGRGRVLE